MPYIVCFFLIMLSFIFRKSKVVAVCDALFMWTLGAFNYYNPDYGAYVKAYNRLAVVDTAEREIGFTLVCKFFNFLRLPYNYALGFMLGISILLLYAFFIKMSKSPALAMALYMIFCPTDCWGVRNFVMYSIIMYGISLIFDSDEKPSRTAIYLILNLIACSFHVLGVLYLPLPFIFKVPLKKLERICVAVSVAIFVCSFFATPFLGRGSVYLGGFAIFWQAGLFLIRNCLYLLAALYAYQRYGNNGIKELSSHSPNQSEHIAKCFIYLSVYNLLLFRNLNFFRISHDAIPLLIIQIERMIKVKMALNEFILLASLFSVILFSVIYYIDNGVGLLFEHNYLFSPP